MEITNRNYLPSAADRAAEQAGLLARQLQGRDIDKNSPLFRVCQEFEAIFIKQMLNSMRRTVEKAGLLEGGLAEEFFEDMLYDERQFWIGGHDLWPASAVSLNNLLYTGGRDFVYKSVRNSGSFPI
jgi:hypothetical protein